MDQNTLIYTLHEGDRRLEVHQKDNKRWLEFGDGIIQSIIDVQNPAHLPSTANRAMLACLLFIDTPKQMLLLGTGGGAIARHCHNCEPTIRGYAVEQSAGILQLARDYFDFPGQQQGWQCRIGDVREYFVQDTNHYDLIILDIADPTLTPDWALDPDYLDQCRRHLQQHGVLVLNLLCRDETQFTNALWSLRRAFDSHTVCMSVPLHSNIIVFAFNVLPPYRDHTELRLRADALQAQWHIELPVFLEIMLRDNPAGSGVL